MLQNAHQLPNAIRYLNEFLNVDVQRQVDPDCLLNRFQNYVSESVGVRSYFDCIGSVAKIRIAGEGNGES